MIQLANISEEIKTGKGVGLGFLDFDGSLVAKISSLIPQEREQDVVHFSPENQHDTSHTGSFHPKYINAFGPESYKERCFMAEFYLRLLSWMFDQKDTGIVGPRGLKLWENAIYAAMSMNKGNLNEAVLLNSYDILEQEKLDSMLSLIQDKIAKKYWQEKAEELKKPPKWFVNTTLNYIGSKLKKLFGLLKEPTLLTNLFSVYDPSLDFDWIIENRYILLADLSILKDSKESQILVGSIIALQAFLSSQRQDKEKIILYTKHLDYLEPNLLKAIEEDKEKRLLVLPADQK